MDLTLQQLVDIGRAMETSERQIKSIEGATSRLCLHNDNPTVAAVHQTDNRRRQHSSTSRHPTATSSRQICRHCGKNFPHSGGRTSCPAYGSRCNACHKFNHYAKMCQSSNQNNADFTSSTRQPTYQPSHRSQPSRSRHPVHLVTSDDVEQQHNSDSDEDDQGKYVFHVNYQTPKQLRPHVKVKVNDSEIPYALSSTYSPTTNV